MLEESNKAAGDTTEASMVDKTELHESSVMQRQKTRMSPSSLKRRLRTTYGRRTMVLVDRYFRSMSDLATYTSNAAFLVRCRAMGVVPREYRVECRDIKYTRHVVRILDECSYRLMLAHLDYNRLRKAQVSRLQERLREKLEKVMSPQDLSSVVVLAEAKHGNIFEATKDKQRGIFDELLKEYGIDQKKKGDKEE
ncbi:uncharacterized protein LOC144171925 [Haemaphysalis longicornis]